MKPVAAILDSIVPKDQVPKIQARKNLDYEQFQ